MAMSLGRTLRRAAVLRGIAAFALGAYLVSREPTTAADVARASAAYWIVDGLVTLWAAGLAGLALGRVVVRVRGAVAILAGLIILGLPLGVVFGPWQPGQALLWMSVTGLMLAVIGFQIGAGAFDVLICREIRRRLPGEWSFAVGAVLSVALAVVAAATFTAPATLLGRILAAGSIAGGLGLLVGAFRLDESRAASSLPAYSRKR